MYACWVHTFELNTKKHGCESYNTVILKYDRSEIHLFLKYFIHNYILIYAFLSLRYNKTMLSSYQFQQQTPEILILILLYTIF